MGFYSKECVIKNKLGIHARPSSLIVRTAAKHSLPAGAVSIESLENGTVSDPTSIMSIMMLAAAQGAKLRVSTQDKKLYGKAVDALAEAIANMEYD